MRESCWLASIGCVICLYFGRWHGEQLACLRDVVATGAIGEQSVVTNAMETAGQHVDEEAADEFVRRQRHSLVAARPIDPIVFVFEGDACLIGRNQSPVGDGDAVCIARQIAQHLLGSAEWALAVDHPFSVTQRYQKRGKRFVLGERGMLAEELQLSGAVGEDKL